MLTKIKNLAQKLRAKLTLAEEVRNNRLKSLYRKAQELDTKVSDFQELNSLLRRL